LYISTHRYEHGKYWPNLAESDFDHIGEGDGKGFNVNIPLNKVRNSLLNIDEIISKFI
jgi:acetoin utilization deacetylase AcuC-like enzyme